jgi:hypothetical protein
MRMLILVDEEPPWAMRKIENIYEDPGSIEALQLIRSKLRLCRESHTACKSRGIASGLPTRILDVGFLKESGEMSVALVERKGLKAPYLALSHRWGDSGDAVMPTTDSTNIATRKKEIEFSTLPRTFQDAIILARSLRIQYLWIDSLCILQGDTQDWEKESLQMASIYRNARLVISAASAPNCNAGLFVRRSPQAKYRVHESKSLISTIYLRPTLLHGDFSRSEKSASPVTQNPLFTRAWAFQERLFARRAIHFCSGELVWECNSTVCCECGDLDGMSPLESLKLDQNEVLVSKASHIGGHRASHLVRRLKFWEEMIRQFTRRRLTYDRDRLPALSSLAEITSSPELGIYFAGMWCYSIVEKDGLCWRRISSRSESSITNGVRSSQYCAPTWSWASISGEIELDGIASIWPATGNKRYEDMLFERAEVLSIQCTLVNEDLPFSSVVAGHIEISGLWTYVTPDEWSNKEWKFGAPVQGLKKTFYPDFNLELESASDSKRFTYLWLKSFTSMGNPGRYTEVIVDVALVLERSKAWPGRYERVGLLIVYTFASTQGFTEHVWTCRKEFLSKTLKGVFIII